MNDSENAPNLAIMLSAEEICRLFQEIEARLNWPIESNRRERWIFEHVLGESQETLEIMWRFLIDVTTCPPEIILYCQEHLALTLPVATG